MSLTFEYILTNGIRLHCALAGPEDGDPVILLHGFPDAWFGWEKQIYPLAKAGFRVIVPDQRGYNLSDKPKGISSYRMEILVEDILGLANKFGYEKIHLAGHDFGAMVAWNFAVQHPARLKRLAIANVPHPTVMRNYLSKHISQILKSWYALFFQLPGIPEWILMADDWQVLLSAMPENFTESERNRYREAWSQTGAITGMINWYRATLRSWRSISPETPIQVPTLVIWGAQDPHLSYEMAPLSINFCETGRLETFEDASHWVMHDKPDEVSQLLFQHFRSVDDPLPGV